MGYYYKDKYSSLLSFDNNEGKTTSFYPEGIIIINNEEIDLHRELKQHLNLSNSTWITIEEDMKNFPISENENNLSGFLNTIFKNFYELADASISLRLINKKEYLLCNSSYLAKQKIKNNYLEDELLLSSTGNSIIYVVENNTILSLI